MMIESLNAWRKTKAGGTTGTRKSGQHSWVDGLPLKMRFHRSKLYISAIPPAVIGMFIGFWRRSWALAAGS